MKNNIEPTYVTFEQAKWLKEKGFDKKVHQYFQFIRNKSSKLNETWQFTHSSFLVRESDAAMSPDEGKNGVEISAYSDRIFRDYNFKTSEDFISVPEQHTVVEWASLVHNIDIEARPVRYAGDIKSSYYQPYINGCIVNMSKFETRQEAYSSAFEYIRLNNLI